MARCRSTDEPHHKKNSQWAVQNPIHHWDLAKSQVAKTNYIMTSHAKYTNSALVFDRFSVLLYPPTNEFLAGQRLSAILPLKMGS